jgi:hypothetical protein
MPNDAFLARRRLATQAGEMTIFGLTALEQAGLTQLDRLPFSIRLAARVWSCARSMSVASGARTFGRWPPGRRDVGSTRDPSCRRAC